MTPIVKGPYNPGMHPFAPMPVVRFDGERELGDPGVAYEFNVKIQRIESAADQADWDLEVERHLERFEFAVRERWPWIGRVYLTGCSGGWLAIEDPSGKMRRRTLDAMARAVEKALASFKRHMVRIYPRKGTT